MSYLVPNVFVGDSGDVDVVQIDDDFALCTLGLNNVFLAGALGARPAVTTSGQPRYYFATDDRGGTLYRDPSDGSAWQQVGAPVQGAEFVDQLTGLGLAKTSGTSLTVTVGAAVSDDAVVLSRLLMNLPTAITGTTGGTWVVGTNQPKLDAGVVGVSQWWHVFLIARTDTGVVDILLSLSAIAPLLPPSYSKKRRLGAVFVDGAGLLVDFVQDGDWFQWAVPVADLAAVNPGIAAVLRTLSVPTGLPVLWVGAAALANAGATCAGLITDPATVDTSPAVVFQLFVTPTVSQISTCQLQVRTNASAQVRFRLSFSDGTTDVSMMTTGWIDRRGRG